MNFVALAYPQETVGENAFEQLKNANESDNVFSEAVLWRMAGKDLISVKGTGREEAASVYYMKGQPGAVFGKGLVSGRYFTEGEENVCLLGRETARNLFGSENILGMKVSWKDKEYMITGIVEGEQLLFIVPGENNMTYDGIAVRKIKNAQSSEKTFSVIESALGTVGDQRIDGHLYYMTACLFYFFMIALLIVFCGLKVKNRKMIFLLCIILAIEFFVLGVKVSAFGSDYLPPYWSDFGFFTKLFDEKRIQIEGLMHHQEFAPWQKMFGIWTQIITTEILLLLLSVSTWIQQISISERD